MPSSITAGHLNNSSEPKMMIFTDFKILGLQLSDNLHWDCNVEFICNKISSKLYFLKLLKRAGLSTDYLKYFYVTVIRPICTIAPW